MVFPFLKGVQMKESKKIGFIRRMDDFGRIILPKEIRHILNISEGEPLEVSLTGRGIYIEKYQPLQTLDSLCEQYLSVLFKNCSVACAICSGEHVIASRGINLSSEQILSESLRRHIHNLDFYSYSEESPISVFDDGKYLLDTVYPVGTKENPLGAVILLHYRSTTPEERSCAKLTAGILTELTINQ